MKLVIAVAQGEDAQHTVEPGDFLAAFPVEVQVGSATVFVVPVDSFEKDPVFALIANPFHD